MAATSTQIVDLQTQINRYAALAGFPSVPTDGQLTQDMLAAALRALGWIAGGGSITDEADVTVDVTDAEANRASALIVVTDQAALRNDPSNVTAFLQTVGDRMGIDVGTSGSTGETSLAVDRFIQKIPFLQTAVAPVARWQPRVPLWAKLAGIAGIIAIGVGVYRHIRRARPAPMP